MIPTSLDLETTVMTHLNRLAAEIGPRPVGSAGNLAAAAHIRDVFRSAGLEVSEQRYDWPDWQCQDTRLQSVGRTLAAEANPFSLPCDLTAPTVILSTIAELEAAYLRGKIGVLVGELARDILLPKAYTVYVDERSQRLVGLLERAAPDALLTLRSRAAPTVGLMGNSDPVIADIDLPIPSASVPPDAALWLIQHTGEPAHLRIEASRTPSHSANIVATTGPAEQRVVLCAHYDTKFGTPGAFDNASGAAALLTLASLLAHRERSIGLEFIAFTDEEYAGHDSSEYLRHRGDLMGGIAAAINMDGIGQWLGTNTIMIAGHSEVFQAAVTRLTAGYPGVAWVDPWVESDHSIFAFRGVPVLALSSTGGVPLVHAAADTVEWISPAKLAEAVSLAAAIIDMLDDKPVGWTRPAAE